MKSVILVVDDSPDILHYLRTVLEDENYKIITASNGKEAIIKMSELNMIPNLIISDIMMPNMDGYEFFQYISKNDYLNQIPFIFLTARTSINDIRFGKMLGVDDYITKPFEKNDLLAIIKGKILRHNKINEYNRHLINALDKEKILNPELSNKNNITILIVFWDNEFGPKLDKYYPSEIDGTLPIRQVAIQLYMAANSIYGEDNFLKAEGLLLDIKNINKRGYIFFDCFPDDLCRGGYRNYMLGILASEINYFQSLKIREILVKLSNKIKKIEDYDILNYWKLVSEII
ncbi:MAG: response regulator [Candidatus Lokiarchaeota archaeon]|nr:response regulator [Candidatus Lokiarchaeota archaeon]